MRRASAVRIAAALLSLGVVPVVLPAPPAGAQVLVDEFDVFSNVVAGTNSVALDPAKVYLVEASGRYSYDLFGTGLTDADAECHNLVTGTPMLPAFWDIFFGVGQLDLFVDGQDRVFSPSDGASPLGCSDPLLGGSHTYTTQFSPAAAGPVNFRINDQNPFDNTGSIHVKIFELGEGPAGPPGVPVSVVVVNSRSPNDTSTVVPLIADVTYVIEASGSFNYRNDLEDADAECSVEIGDPVWEPARFGLLLGLNWLDLLVNGDDVNWQPVDEVDPGCSSNEHTYRIEFTPSATGPVSFRIHDTNYFDNEGFLTVVVFLAV